MTFQVTEGGKAPRTMKVAHLTTVDLSLRFLIGPQLESIVSMGGEAIGISAPGPWVDDLADAGIRHVALDSSTRGMAPVEDIRAAVQLWKVLRQEKPDILHTHTPKPGLYGRILGRLAAVPVVVNTVHGLYATPDDHIARRLIVYLLEAIASRFSDAELVQSSEDLALIAKWRIAPAGRVRLLGNGVDLIRFKPAIDNSDERAGYRAKLGLKEGQIAVGAVGRLVAEKGFLELFEAVRLLGDRYVVLVAGPSEPSKGDAVDEETLREAERGGVRFLGMRTDVEDIYRALDIFVLPSHREGFPRAAMEAAASGLPIVATNIRGCREVVEHGVNGLLIPVRDPTALATAIRKIGDDPGLRRRMGIAGYERAQRRFDENAIVATVLDTYRQLAVSKGLPNLARELGVTAQPLTVRRAVASDIPRIASMHMEGISTGFLSSLGRRFLMALYRALLGWPSAVVLVADSGAGPIGFVAGVTDTAAFYKHFLIRSGIKAGLIALPQLLRPTSRKKAWETLRYRDRSRLGEATAELLSMAVEAPWRGQGIAQRLGMGLLESSVMAQAGAVKVVVGASNSGAIAAYRRMGFSSTGLIEVHGGESSMVMVRSR